MNDVNDLTQDELAFCLDASRESLFYRAARQIQRQQGQLTNAYQYAESLRQRVIDRESDTPSAREWDDGLLQIADELTVAISEQKREGRP